LNSAASLKAGREPEMKNYTAFKDRMLKRPAVQRVVENEKVRV
jgi:hypothetical protein